MPQKTHYRKWLEAAQAFRTKSLCGKCGGGETAPDSTEDLVLVEKYLMTTGEGSAALWLLRQSSCLVRIGGWKQCGRQVVIYLGGQGFVGFCSGLQFVTFEPAQQPISNQTAVSRLVAHGISGRQIIKIVQKKLDELAASCP